MKPLPVILFVVFALPILAMPGISGKGVYIEDISLPKIGDWSFDNFMSSAWDWIKEKFVSGVGWIGNLFTGALSTIKGWVNSALKTVLGDGLTEGQGWVFMTTNLIFAVGWILLIVGLIRIWVLILDILPIF